MNARERAQKRLKKVKEELAETEETLAGVEADNEKKTAENAAQKTKNEELEAEVAALEAEAKAKAVADTQVALTEDGLQHRTAETLPFDQMAKAHEIIEAGSVRGCVVVTI